MSEPMSPEGYAAAAGQVCPVCGSADITQEVDYSKTDFRTVIQAADCLACHAEWEAIYELTGYQALTPGEKETP